MKTRRPRTRAQLLERLAEQSRILNDPATPLDQIETARWNIDKTLALLSFRPRVHPVAHLAGLVVGWLIIALIGTGLVAGMIAITRAVF